jgi:predicted PurR-regulated permease PerM
LLASTAIILAGLYFGRDVLVPLALAVLLTFLLAPVTNWLERFRMPRVVSVVLTVVITFAGIGGIGYLVLREITTLSEDLPRYQDDIVQKIQHLRPRSELVDRFSKATERVEQALQANQQPTTTPSTTTSIVGNLLGTPTPDDPIPVREYPEAPSPLQSFGAVLGQLLGPLGTAGLVIVLVLFMLLDREDLRDRLLALIGKGRIDVSTQALHDAGTRISRYLAAQAIVNGSYGLVVLIGLQSISFAMTGKPFPSALLWALLCAVLRFIPYLGPWLAAAFPVLLSFAAYPGYGVFIAVLAMFVINELISNNVLEPWLYGSSTGMSTMAVLAAAAFWTWLWGPIGLVLSTPITVCLVVIGKHVPQLAFFDVLLGDGSALTPPQRLYQRLLSGDEVETVEIVKEWTTQHGNDPVRLYDELLVVALQMGERDFHAERIDEARVNRVRQMILQLARAAAADAPPPNDPTRGEGKLPKVLILPVSDEGDAVCAQMLALLLKRLPCEPKALSAERLTSELVEKAKTANAELIILSALPPEAVRRTYYLLQKLRTLVEPTRLISATWTLRNRERLSERLRHPAVLIRHSMQSTIELARERVQAATYDRERETADGVPPALRAEARS